MKCEWSAGSIPVHFVLSSWQNSFINNFVHWACHFLHHDVCGEHSQEMTWWLTCHDPDIHLSMPVQFQSRLERSSLMPEWKTPVQVPLFASQIQHSQTHNQEPHLKWPCTMTCHHWPTNILWCPFADETICSFQNMMAKDDLQTALESMSKMLSTVSCNRSHVKLMFMPHDCCLCHCHLSQHQHFTAWIWLCLETDLTVWRSQPVLCLNLQLTVTATTKKEKSELKLWGVTSRSPKKRSCCVIPWWKSLCAMIWPLLQKKQTMADSWIWSVRQAWQTDCDPCIVETFAFQVTLDKTNKGNSDWPHLKWRAVLAS